MAELNRERERETEGLQEKKRLEVMVFLSILAHILAIYMVLPEFKSNKLFKPPERKIVVVRNWRPPPPKEEVKQEERKTEAKEKRRVMPVPDATPDEPEEEYEFEPEPEYEDLVIPDDATIVFGVPEAPPEGEIVKPLRITGDVKAPVILKRVNPDYPELARKANIQGRVIIEAIISKTGDVIDARVLRGLGKSGCDEAALEAVMQWKFNPATLNGVPVDVYMSVTVDFTLSS